MKVNIQKISKSQIEVEVEIPSEKMDNFFNQAAANLSKDLKVKGFRPGKVPLDIVERELGSEKVFNEAANLAVRRTLPQVVLEHQLEIIGKPELTVTQIAKGNPMKYKIKAQTIPEVELGKYKGLGIKKKKIEMKDEEVNKALEYLQKSRTKLITVNRPAKKGDKVEIDFQSRAGGVKVEGGESKNHPLVIGESRFMPGFEDNLEGMKTGEEKEFSLEVPKDYYQKKLAGKLINFKIKMNLVQEREIPKLDDSFAKSLGDFKGLEDLKKNVREGLTKEKEVREKEKVRIELIEKAAQNSKMEIPGVLIDEELDKMLTEFRGSITNMGLDFDKYLNEIKKNVEELKKEWREQAEKRVRIALTLKAIAKKEGIDANENEVKEKMDEILKQYSSVEEAKKNIDPEALKEYTKGVLRNEKVFELLEKEANLE